MRLFSAGGVAVGSLATSYIGVGLSQIRHADGGKTTTENGAAVCTDCHKELHKTDYE